MNKKVELPEWCYSTLNTTGEIIVIRRYENCYYQINSKTNMTADELNEQIGITTGQSEAMLNGSMWGWNCPASDSNKYDNEGIYRKEL